MGRGQLLYVNDTGLVHTADLAAAHLLIVDVTNWTKGICVGDTLSAAIADLVLVLIERHALPSVVLVSRAVDLLTCARGVRGYPRVLGLPQLRRFGSCGTTAAVARTREECWLARCWSIIYSQECVCPVWSHSSVAEDAVRRPVISSTAQ